MSDYKNIFNPSRGQLVIPGAKDLEYNLKQFTIPSITMSQIEVPTPFHDMKDQGDKAQFQTLSLTFNIDERLKNYMQIYKWIRGTAQPTGFQEYNRKFEDIKIIMYDSQYIEIGTITVIDQFPVSLSEVEIGFEEPSTEPRVATAEFEYLYYDINFPD